MDLVLKIERRFGERESATLQSARGFDFPFMRELKERSRWIVETVQAAR